VVAAKVKAAYRHGLTPILCCGEGLDVRKQGGQVEHVVTQVDAALAGVSPEQVRSIVIAYEPIWAIGTGEVATPADAQEVCSAIRTRLAELYSGDTADGIRILYGGSVKAGNVARDHGPGRRGRSAGRRCVDRGGRLRLDLPLPRSHQGRLSTQRQGPAGEPSVGDRMSGRV